MIIHGECWVSVTISSFTMALHLKIRLRSQSCGSPSAATVGWSTSALEHLQEERVAPTKKHQHCKYSAAKRECDDGEVKKEPEEKKGKGTKHRKWEKAKEELKSLLHVPYQQDKFNYWLLF